MSTARFFFNKAAERLLGMSADYAVGKTLGNLLYMWHDEKGNPVPDEKRPGLAALKGEWVHGNYRLLRGSKPLMLSVTASPIFLKGRIIGSISVMRDVTREMAIDKAKSEFVSIASHQLRTPPSSIRWYTEMLLAGEAGEITKKQKEYLEEIYHSNQRIVSLINDLLNVSKIELGTFTIEPEEVDAEETAEQAIAEFLPEISQKKLKILKRFEKAPDKIETDPRILFMILENLIGNAVKYTPNGGSISITVKKQGTQALIEIKDTGYGIPKREQTLIFTKLFRAENVRGKETEGSGLGLYIVKSIVEHSGGKIWFESKEGKGTAFYVLLPLKASKKRRGTTALL